jgi:hypothetical protein
VLLNREEDKSVIRVPAELVQNSPDVSVDRLNDPKRTFSWQ